MAAAALLPKRLALAKIMANWYDTPMKRRSQFTASTLHPPLEEQEEMKCKLAMSEDPCWKTTGRATVKQFDRPCPTTGTPLYTEWYVVCDTTTPTTTNDKHSLLVLEGQDNPAHVPLIAR
jgi:hypothetical protein